MIIDAHTHIGFGPAIDARASSLAASMRKAKIDMSLVFAGRINGIGTERLMKEIAPYKDMMVGIGSITPTARTLPTTKRVDGWLKSGLIRGLKFYPGYEYFYPYDKKLRPYLRLLEKHDLPAIFHSGDTYSRVHAAKLRYAYSIHLDELATEMPKLKIIIAHIGYPWAVDTGEVVYKNKNVYTDCSGFVYGKFKAKSRAHFRDVVREYRRVAGGLDRMIFGTDWPIGEQASYLAAAKSVFGRDPHAKKIFSGNAIKLFGL